MKGRGPLAQLQPTGGQLAQDQRLGRAKSDEGQLAIWLFVGLGRTWRQDLGRGVSEGGVAEEAHSCPECT